MTDGSQRVLEDTIAAIAPLDATVAARTQRLLDGKTKPRRSLGRLEDLACRVAAIRGVDVPPLPRKAIVVACADHGVAAEGVSAYPREVTAQMVLNFARGGAAINVLARHAGAEVIVLDVGVAEELPPLAGVRSHRLGAGTASFTRGPAMARADAVAAVAIGIEVARELAAGGVALLATGDMGIGNTTASSALTAVFLDADPAEVTGRGTGVDDDGLARKIDAIRRGIACNRPRADDPLDVLAKLGGFEIGALAGVVLGGAAARVPIVIDGFIAGAAALVAARLAPAAADYLIASHRSVEIGHARILAALGLRPLLDLELRLGEGTGAALAMPIVEAALRILHEMATFEAAGVTDAGA